MSAESARWGDSRRGSPPYTPDSEWTDELNRLLETYFPQRTDVVLSQLQQRGLYPEIVAPWFNQHGGFVSPGFDILMSAPAGTIDYTTDGSDPRLPGSAISRSAVEFTKQLNITEDSTIKSRVYHEGEWSSLNEATFIVAPPRPGDANRDGVLNQLDIVQVLQAGEYRTGEPATFAEGDWNDDGVFDQLDIVIALATGNYLEGPNATLFQAAGVDELLALGGMSAGPFR